MGCNVVEWILQDLGHRTGEDAVCILIYHINMYTYMTTVTYNNILLLFMLYMYFVGRIL
jgi:hypothetical protein